MVSAVMLPIVIRAADVVLRLVPAFFLAEEGNPGAIVEAGPTAMIFSTPSDPRTLDYVNGRFG